MRTLSIVFSEMKARRNIAIQRQDIGGGLQFGNSHDLDWPLSACDGVDARDDVGEVIHQASSSR